MFFKIIIYCLCTTAGLLANIEQEDNIISLQEMNAAMLESVGLKGKHGVIVTDVNENSPVTKELKQGDVIVVVNGEKVHKPNQLMQVFDNAQDEKIPLIIWRENEFKGVFIYPFEKSVNEDILGGVEFRNTKHGVVVNRPGKTGLFETGDYVLEFNGKPVRVADDIAKCKVNKHNGFSVVVNRNGAQITRAFASGSDGSFFSQSIVVR